MPCLSNFSAKKTFTLSLTILITCQLVFGNFLFFPALAEGTEATIVDTPIEEPIAPPEPTETTEPTEPAEALLPAETTPVEPSENTCPDDSQEPTITETPPEEPVIEPTSTEPINETTTTTPEIILPVDEPLITDFATTTEPLTDPSMENSTTTFIISDTPVVPEVSHEIITGIIRNLSINNLTIVGQWQMNSQKENDKYLGTDDNQDKGAQFLPSGQYEVDKTITACAIVADQNGLDNIKSVSAAINYPENIIIGQTETGEKLGCGQEKNKINLEKLDQDQAMALICDQIRNNNNNLLSWNNSPEDLAYSYDQVCGIDGYLAKQTAAIYCAATNLAYNDPAGDYQLKITAENNSNSTIVSTSTFKYLELTTFANDFSNIQYGPVKLNELKTLSGDLIWGNDIPTIRNTGNTRLLIKVLQNDFGFGKTNDQWNISYTTRVGETGEFISYNPEEIITINTPLELGQLINIDFGALVAQFPGSSEDTAFAGNMTLSAEKVDYLTCESYPSPL